MRRSIKTRLDRLHAIQSEDRIEAFVITILYGREAEPQGTFVSAFAGNALRIKERVIEDHRDVNREQIPIELWRKYDEEFGETGQKNDEQPC